MRSKPKAVREEERRAVESARLNLATCDPADRELAAGVLRGAEEALARSEPDASDVALTRTNAAREGKPPPYMRVKGTAYATRPDRDRPTCWRVPRAPVRRDRRPACSSPRPRGRRSRSTSRSSRAGPSDLDGEAEPAPGGRPWCWGAS